MLEPRAKGRPRFVEIAARILFLEGRGTHRDAVDFDRRTRWIAGDMQFVGESVGWAR